jgi:Flp pilus assembly protein protease CpaA
MLLALFTTIWITVCGAWDWQARRVPNGLMALGGLAALVYRVSRLASGAGSPLLEAGITLLAGALALGFWLARVWGAADAKFVMALALAFPDLGMLAVMLAANLLLSLSARWFLKNKNLPAVAFLGAGWLAWAGVFIFGGRA